MGKTILGSGGMGIGSIPSMGSDIDWKKLMMGGVTHEGNVDLLNPQQQQYLGSAMGGLSQLGQQQDPQQFQQMFQQSFVDPAQQQMQRQTIPGIKESFMGMDESGSSALNQALSQSATDLSTALGGQMMNQFNLGQNRQAHSLGMLGQMSGQQIVSPMIHEQEGVLGNIIDAIGRMLGGN